MTSPLDNIKQMQRALSDAPPELSYCCLDTIKAGEMMSTDALFGTMKIVYFHPDDYQALRKTLVSKQTEYEQTIGSMFFVAQIAAIDAAYQLWRNKQEQGNA